MRSVSAILPLVSDHSSTLSNPRFSPYGNPLTFLFETQRARAPRRRRPLIGRRPFVRRYIPRFSVYDGPSSLSV